MVLIAGDEEYRSEEALPQLGKILARHHGFDAVVLFPINPPRPISIPITPATFLDWSNWPGRLDGHRHSLSCELPDDQMQHIVDYVNAGKPVIGLRTATHAFNYGGKRARASSWIGATTAANGKVAFGQQVLGDTWISHHGKHGSQSTRGVIHPGSEAHPVLKGVKDVLGPTDVYGIKNLVPKPLCYWMVKCSKA